jgi:hypothetical protein
MRQRRREGESTGNEEEREPLLPPTQNVMGVELDEEEAAMCKVACFLIVLMVVIFTVFLVLI